MFDLVERAELLMEESRLYSAILSEGPTAKDPGGMAFSMIHNKAMITREVLQFYYRLWTGGVRKYDIDDDELSTEMAERSVYLGKMLFVEALSAIEHSAKKVARQKGMAEGQLSLRSIMDRTMAEGRMTPDRNREWNDIITVRNLAVHDNSISDRSKKCIIGPVSISMRPNRMMKGPVHTFIELARVANHHYYEWLRTMNTPALDGRADLAIEGND